jgi:DNA topoisomerase-1
VSKTLLIIESPGKKAKLESILGAGYMVRASFGHIRDLPEKEIGVQAPDYKPKYVVSARAKKTVDELKKVAEGAERVLLATDPDREGEAIAWHVAQALKIKNPQRVTYQEITDKAVKTAVASPRPLDMHLVHAQEARRVLDRLVGYEVSPALSDKAGRRLSAGRVQSPAVRLVVERERAIRAFKPTTHYGAELAFNTPAPPWKAAWQTKPHLAAGTEYLLDAALAEAAAAVRRVRVTAFADTQATAAPPAPFTTSTLQQRAQVALKMKPKKTMDVAQKLYEQGVITYMRTDSPNLSDEACNDITAYAQANGLPLAEKRRKWKAKGNAQEAHEAIRPAHVEDLDAGQTEDEKALYKLIWSRAVASQLADATYAVRTATLESIEPIAGDVRATYIARGRTLTDKGWKALYDEPEDESDSNDDDADNPVPALAIGAEIDVDRGAVLTKTTKAPPRYTLATLVKELEANGIGRPATYAAILDNITQREYITEDKKGFLSATATAETIVDSLAGTFRFIELDYTRDLEGDLDEIAEGKKAYRDVVAEAHGQLAAEIGRLGPGQMNPCPDCGKPLRKRSGKTGAFWGCSGYPDCTTTLPDADGKPGERAARATPAPASAHVCTDCGKPLRRNTRAAKDDPKGKGWDFYGCTGWPTCKKTYKVDGDGAPILS